MTPTQSTVRKKHKPRELDRFVVKHSCGCKETYIAVPTMALIRCIGMRRALKVTIIRLRDEYKNNPCEECASSLKTNAH